MKDFTATTYARIALTVGTHTEEKEHVLGQKGLAGCLARITREVATKFGENTIFTLNVLEIGDIALKRERDAKARAAQAQAKAQAKAQAQAQAKAKAQAPKKSATTKKSATSKKSAK